MTSAAQIAANRRNAKRSTGPKTNKGKTTSARNAVQHGLTAEKLVVQDEDAQAWTDYCEALRAQFDPVGPLEDLLVDRIAGCAWRLLRAGHVEASLFRHQALDQKAKSLRGQARDLEIKGGLDDVSDDMLKMLTTHFTDPEEHARLLRQAAATDDERDQEMLAATFVADARSANALSLFSRYEVARERSLYKALHELQRLQAARAGKPAPLPIAVDVDVSSPAG